MEYRSKRFGFRILALILSITAAILIFSCNNPYAGIGEKLDTSSWIDINADGGIPFVRSFDGGTGLEVLIMEGEVLDGSDFGAVTIIRVSNADLPVESAPRLDIHLLQGSYLISAPNITFDLKKMYSLSFNDTGGSIVTEGSQSETDLDESLSYHSLVLDDDINDDPSDKTIVFSDGTPYTYKRMDLIIDDIMDETDESLKASNIHKLFQISGIFAPQSRVAGFGGMEMLNYTTKTDFSSLMNNEDTDHYMSLQLKQTLKATTTFSFTEACDLKPFRINGEYVSVASMTGSGPLSGIIDFSMEGSSQTWNCSLDFNDIYVTNTVASSGTYLLNINGGAFQSIAFDNVNPGVIDFSTIPSMPVLP